MQNLNCRVHGQYLGGFGDWSISCRYTELGWHCLFCQLSNHWGTWSLRHVVTPCWNMTVILFREALNFAPRNFILWHSLYVETHCNSHMLSLIFFHIPGLLPVWTSVSCPAGAASSAGAEEPGWEEGDAGSSQRPAEVPVPLSPQQSGELHTTPSRQSLHWQAVQTRS